MRYGLAGLVIVVVIGGLMARPGAQVADRAEVLLQAARTKQLVERRLEEAIQLYQQVMKQSGANRAVTGKALLGMAQSYEKLGRPEARDTYAQIVREYGDQPLVAREARVRLAAVASASKRQSGPQSPRRVIADQTIFVNDVTPDGRVAVGVTSETPARLVLQDVTTGQTTTLVAGTATAWGRWAVFSADGRQVAYSWTERPQLASLRVIGTATGAQSRTLVAPEPGMQVMPLGWSPDGRAILTLRWGPTADAGSTIAWIGVADGSIRTIKSLEPWRQLRQLDLISGVVGPRLSPDGNSIAYSASAREGSPDRYIYTVDANGQNEVAVVREAGANTHPVWTPDGGHLLYLSQRAGSVDLMAVSIQGGVASGEPSRIHMGLAGYPIALTRSGDLFYQQSDGPVGTMAELVAERTPSGARVVQTFKGLSGTWSKGNQLAFVRPTGTEGAELIVRSMDTGEERLYKHPGLTNVSPRWLPDDSAVIVFASAPGDAPRPGGTFYLANLKTSRFTRLFDRDTPSHMRSAVSALAPDGKTLFLLARKDAQSPWTGIVGVDLGTGIERAIVSFPGAGFPGGAPGIAVSPDGNTLVLQGWVDGPRSGKARLVTVRVDGTDYRELYGPFEGTGFADITRWTPDGQSIVFVAGNQNTPGAAAGWRVMRIPATGGQPVPDGLASPGLTGSVPIPEVTALANMDLSPDGTRIVVSIRTKQTWAVWTLENVKSLLNTRR